MRHKGWACNLPKKDETTLGVRKGKRKKKHFKENKLIPL